MENIVNEIILAIKHLYKRYTSNNKDLYNFKTNNINNNIEFYIIGHSAGGHLGGMILANDEGELFSYYLP